MLLFEVIAVEAAESAIDCILSDLRDWLLSRYHDTDSSSITQENYKHHVTAAIRVLVDAIMLFKYSTLTYTCNAHSL